MASLSQNAVVKPQGDEDTVSASVDFYIEVEELPDTDEAEDESSEPEPYEAEVDAADVTAPSWSDTPCEQGTPSIHQALVPKDELAPKRARLNNGSVSLKAGRSQSAACSKLHHKQSVQVQKGANAAVEPEFHPQIQPDISRQHNAPAGHQQLQQQGYARSGQQPYMQRKALEDGTANLATVGQMQQQPYQHHSTKQQQANSTENVVLSQSRSEAVIEVVTEGGDAICLRTRSKHPLGSQQFDPDEFDRLLAEFDPDVEPLMDDVMYQEFLQTLQAEGADEALPLGASGSATAVTATAAGAAKAVAASVAAPMTTVLGYDDDDDDEEFFMDPLDWLLDDEQDAAEEERLARLVQHQQHQGATVTAGTAGGPDWIQAGAGVEEKRRTQREAARRAAERIAQKQLMQQQQQILGQAGVQQRQVSAQQQNPENLDGSIRQHQDQQRDQQRQVLAMRADAAAAVGAGAASGAPLQPLIPATAAGMPVGPEAAAGDAGALAAQLWPSVSTEGSIVQPSLLPHQAQGASAGASLMPGMQQNHISDAAAAAGATPALLTHGLGAADAADPAAAAAAAMPLILADTQLQQLYHQISLHTQLLTQLYVLTARDPDPESQLIASSVGQMLDDIKRMHGAATGSYRGMQLGGLVQQAFKGTFSFGANAIAGSTTAGGQWRPPVNRMITVWDTLPLRLLDDVVSQLPLTPMADRPLLSQLLGTPAPDPSASGTQTLQRYTKRSATASNKAALQDVKAVLHDVLGPFRGGYDAAAWPQLAPKGRQGVWSAAEDDLLWLGIVRFHNAITPMMDCAQTIAEELLPNRTIISIYTRYKNMVGRRDPGARLIMRFALLGTEQPTVWKTSDRSATSQPGGRQGIAAEQQEVGTDDGSKHRTQRGAMWAAAELGASLTAAFAACHTGIPSAAAAAAASVLLEAAGAASTEGAASAGISCSGSSSKGAGLCAGEELLRSLVDHIASRLPMTLPSQLDVPSAVSIRSRPWGRSTAPSAEQQLLLSLAACQAVQTDSDKSPDEDMPDADDSPGTDSAAAGARNDVERQHGTEPGQPQQQPAEGIAADVGPGCFNALVQSSSTAGNEALPNRAAAAMGSAAGRFVGGGDRQAEAPATDQSNILQQQQQRNNIAWGRQPATQQKQRASSAFSDVADRQSQEAVQPAVTGHHGTAGASAFDSICGVRCRSAAITANKQSSKGPVIIGAASPFKDQKGSKPSSKTQPHPLLPEQWQFSQAKQPLVRKSARSQQQQQPPGPQPITSPGNKRIGSRAMPGSIVTAAVAQTQLSNSKLKKAGQHEAAQGRAALTVETPQQQQQEAATEPVSSNKLLRRSLFGSCSMPVDKAGQAAAPAPSPPAPARRAAPAAAAAAAAHTAGQGAGIDHQQPKQQQQHRSKGLGATPGSAAGSAAAAADSETIVAANGVRCLGIGLSTDGWYKPPHTAAPLGTAGQLNKAECQANLNALAVQAKPAMLPAFKMAAADRDSGMAAAMPQGALHTAGSQRDRGAGFAAVSTASSPWTSPVKATSGARLLLPQEQQLLLGQLMRQEVGQHTPWASPLRPATAAPRQQQHQQQQVTQQQQLRRQQLAWQHLTSPQQQQHQLGQLSQQQLALQQVTSRNKQWLQQQQHMLPQNQLAQQQGQLSTSLGNHQQLRWRQQSGQQQLAQQLHASSARQQQQRPAQQRLEQPRQQQSAQQQLISPARQQQKQLSTQNGSGLLIPLPTQPVQAVQGQPMQTVQSQPASQVVPQADAEVSSASNTAVGSSIIAARGEVKQPPRRAKKNSAGSQTRQQHATVNTAEASSADANTTSWTVGSATLGVLQDLLTAGLPLNLLSASLSSSAAIAAAAAAAPAGNAAMTAVKPAVGQHQYQQGDVQTGNVGAVNHWSAAQLLPFLMKGPLGAGVSKYSAKLAGTENLLAFTGSRFEGAGVAQKLDGSVSTDLQHLQVLQQLLAQQAIMQHRPQAQQAAVPPGPLTVPPEVAKWLLPLQQAALTKQPLVHAVGNPAPANGRIPPAVQQSQHGAENRPHAQQQQGEQHHEHSSGTDLAGLLDTSALRALAEAAAAAARKRRRKS